MLPEGRAGGPCCVTRPGRRGLAPQGLESPGPGRDFGLSPTVNRKLFLFEIILVSTGSRRAGVSRSWRRELLNHLPACWGSPKPELWGLDKLLSNSSPVSWLQWVHIKSPSFFVVSFLVFLVLCARLSLELLFRLADGVQ